MELSNRNNEKLVDQRKKIMSDIKEIVSYNNLLD